MGVPAIKDEVCRFCGRDFRADDPTEKLADGAECPAIDECPSHWEEKGMPHPDHSQ